MQSHTQSIQNLMNELSRLPGIQEINSIVALSEIKSTTALPL